MRIGFGYDSHRLLPDRPLILGGVQVAFDKGFLGHSDGDVLCHAVIDALLGAAHLGNIGLLYPDDDPDYLGANSLELLGDAALRVVGSGFRIENIDAVIVLERPKLRDYLLAIEETIAGACGLSPAQVSVKPKTDEGLGPAGRGEAGIAYAVALLERR